LSRCWYCLVLEKSKNSKNLKFTKKDAWGITNKPQTTINLKKFISSPKPAPPFWPKKRAPPRLESFSPTQTPITGAATPPQTSPLHLPCSQPLISKQQPLPSAHRPSSRPTQPSLLQPTSSSGSFCPQLTNPALSSSTDHKQHHRTASSPPICPFLRLNIASKLISTVASAATDDSHQIRGRRRPRTSRPPLPPTGVKTSQQHAHRSSAISNWSRRSANTLSSSSSAGQTRQKHNRQQLPSRRQLPKTEQGKPKEERQKQREKA